MLEENNADAACMYEIRSNVGGKYRCCKYLLVIGRKCESFAHHTSFSCFVNYCIFSRQIKLNS